MKTEVIQVGVLATNCYIVSDDTTNECVVIDPGGESARIEDHLENAALMPTFVLATHAHGDHTGAAKSLVEKYGAQFLIGIHDVAAVNQQLEWLVSMLGDFQDPPVPNRGLEHGDKLTVGQVEIEVLSTPGHTPGSVSFYVEGHVYTGDTLFRETIGRFDLSGGDEAKEIASIKKVLFELDDTTVVLPGHGPSSTIGHEKIANMFVR
ncbi:MAG: MBL fold metallo-hydrolase [Chloroflexi bacterium]|nr:MBL fold metallo-hydrolase [Chloroflexota bacterium]